MERVASRSAAAGEACLCETVYVDLSGKQDSVIAILSAQFKVHRDYLSNTM